MTTLITGGTGKTGLILAKLLTDAGHPALVASRKGEAPAPFKAVTFNWFDPSTFENPFTTDRGIDRVYIIAPPTVHPGPIVKPFIDLAITKGVKRFVLLGGSHQTAGSLSTGQVEKILQECGVDFVVPKATWFQDNFGTNLLHSIREQNEIRSSMEDAQAPFVSTRDIAEAAFDCLTAEKLERNEVLVLGPELLSYPEAVKMLSTVLNREIKYTRVTAQQMTAGLLSAGLPQDFAEFFVTIEQGTVQGIDKKWFEGNDPRKRPGKYSLMDYFQENKELWMKA